MGAINECIDAVIKPHDMSKFVLVFESEKKIMVFSSSMDSSLITETLMINICI